MSRTKVSFVLLCAVLALGTRAKADDWNEATNGGGNAGQLLGTFQNTHGNQNHVLNHILGTLTGANDIDLFSIFIKDPVAFSASNAATVDTQLFLFNNAGLGVMFNDDRTAANLNPLLPTAPGRPAGIGPTTAGFYYLGVAKYDHDPQSAGGPIFPASNSTTITGPTNVGGGSPLSGWVNTTPGGAANNAYSITLTGATFGTPEPTTLALYGVGLMGLVKFYRRKKRQAVA